MSDHSVKMFRFFEVPPRQRREEVLAELQNMIDAIDLQLREIQNELRLGIKPETIEFWLKLKKLSLDIKQAGNMYDQDTECFLKE